MGDTELDFEEVIGSETEILRVKEFDFVVENAIKQQINLISFGELLGDVD